MSTAHRLAIAANAFQTRIRYLLSMSDMKKSMCGYNFSGCFALKSTSTLAQPYLITAFDEETPPTTIGSNSKSRSTALSSCSFVIDFSESFRNKSGSIKTPQTTVQQLQLKSFHTQNYREHFYDFLKSLPRASKDFLNGTAVPNMILKRSEKSWIFGANF